MEINRCRKGCGNTGVGPRVGLVTRTLPQLLQLFLGTPAALRKSHTLGKEEKSSWRVDLKKKILT